MSMSTPSTARRSQASIAATALCDDFDLLTSDYGILTGAFPLENPAIRDCFVSRGIVTSMELAELDDEARILKSRVEKDDKKRKYRDNPRERHENARRDLEIRFADLVKILKELKEHLEKSFQFKYLPNCSYRLLGEVGKPPTQQNGIRRDTQQHLNHDEGAAGLTPSVQSHVEPPKDAPSPHIVDTTEGTASPDAVQSLKSIKRRSTRAREPHKKFSVRSEPMVLGKGTVIPAARSSRPRRLVTMGIAEKIANTTLDPQKFDHPFGKLAPEIKTPHQIWEHRFPNGYTRPDLIAEYTRTLEELLAASNRRIKMMSKTRMAKELKAAQVKNRKLTKELDKAKKEIAELQEKNKDSVERLEPQKETIIENQESSPHRILVPDSKSNGKRERHWDEPAQENDSGEDGSRDAEASAKRQRIS
ncbi:hypothetical protein DL98DRAFT_540471 [Cadophora sp. DSE1049]|nr:hypothetical protein DL98DRAFT_540471 [Cadophora sp. DSE1049]